VIVSLLPQRLLQTASSVWLVSPRKHPDFFIFCQNCVFGLNLPTTNSRWPIKDSKDANFRLVCFKETNNCLLGLGPGDLGQKCLNLPLLCYPPNISNPNFIIATTRLSTSLEGLNSSVALAAGGKWANMWLAQSCLVWILKGGISDIH